ncbi:MAG: PHP domain-containing protein [Rikenellaceae bacterium]
MKRLFTLALLLLLSVASYAQLRNSDVYECPQMNKSGIRENIHIPNIAGYKTLKCDFHLHTVFSDGSVWPDIRISEAWQQGLDAVAITDHIEYRPHKNIINADLNESFKIAKKRADAMGIIAIKGIEITRAKPLGHLNALFITDANPMDVKDPLQAIDVALSQGAFIMWNHPGWPDDKSTVYDVHKKLISENKIHGVEVVNCMEYYPSIITFCKENKLAYMGNSDAHDAIANDYGACKTARPMTLVFAKECTESSLKEAMMAKRTAVVFADTYFGPADLMEQLIKASVEIKVINKNDKTANVNLTNNSDITLQLKIGSAHITIPADKTVVAKVALSGKVTVLNCYTAENTNLEFAYPY